MRIKRGFTDLVILFVVSMLCSTSIVYATTDVEPHTAIELVRSPITITGDSALASFCSIGSGTEMDPYIIENFEISGGTEAGIKISDTTAYFVIRNCITQGGYRGIYVTNVAYGTARIENNTCVNNEVCGIQISFAQGSIVVNNSIGQSNERRGLFSYKSSYSNISYNTFEDVGLDIQEFNDEDQATYIITGNIVNGKDLGYFKNINDVTINETIYGQIIIANCTNMIIENQIISKTYIGMAVFHSQNITLSNNSFSNNYDAIWIYYSSNCTFSLNNCTQNSYNGLRAQSSSYLNITANRFAGNRVGMELGASYSNISNNIIENNGEYGIRGGSSSSFYQNYVYNSGYSGMWVSSSNNLIYSNILESNDEYGMDIRGWNNIVYSNKLMNNQVYGVFIMGGSNNLVYKNNFDGNNYHAPHMSQAFDWGLNNSWYNQIKLIGNRWSDSYSFVEYEIEGPAGSYDIYPIFPDSDNDKLPDEWEVIYGLNTNHNDTYLDPDGDLLVNYYEFRNQADPFDPDSDDDLILDGDEVNTYFTNPISSDTDDDNLSDYQEIFTFGTDPLNPDTDGDEIPDGWEANNNLDPLLSDSSLDPDEDSLTNLQEFLYGTDPHVSDTDDDGLTDYEEIFVYETSPIKNDTDRDNLSDGDEVLIYQTNPNSHDSDVDGLNDYNEIMVYGTDPNNRDTDGDGLADGFEITYGFNPLVYTLLPIKNIYLRVGAYASPFILIIVTLVSTILIVRRSRKRKLKEYISVQEKDMISLNNLLVEFNQQDEIELYKFADILTPAMQKIVSNFSFSNNPRKLSKLVKRKISKRFFSEIGFSKLLMELFENFTNSTDKLDYTAIENEINELEEKILEVKEIDTVYSRLNDLKLVLNKNKQMVDMVGDVYNMHSVNVSTDEDQFNTSVMKIRNFILVWVTKINKLEIGKKDTETQFKEIERIKSIEHELQLDSRVSMKKLLPLLDFQTTQDLEKWMLDNFSSVPYSVEEGDIVFKTEDDKAEIMEAIDSLLNEYEKWSDGGEGKKK